ncbi:hypothetical protein [Ruminococcus sp.]|uniref:hypothetical protein n=1 Tax=Ruminococcus sp. TaxID=41978 RepID=UPI0025D613C3|nr:hypothetical protein [Ruminococcus sp.]MBQ9543143.1 hypothetical protein [Ruminococcus sp.]
MDKDVNICAECGSVFLRAASQMPGLCPECSHRLYGYDDCDHVFENGRCTKCLWDGSISEFISKNKENLP